MSTKKAAQARKMMGLAKQRELFEWLYEHKAYEVRHRKGHSGGPVRGVERGQVPSRLQGAVDALFKLGVVEKSYRQFKYRQMGKFQPQKVCDVLLVLKVDVMSHELHRITVGGRPIITTGDLGLRSFDKIVADAAGRRKRAYDEMMETTERNLTQALDQASGEKGIKVLLFHGPTPTRAPETPPTVERLQEGILKWQSPPCTPFYVGGIDPLDQPDGEPAPVIIRKRIGNEGPSEGRLLGLLQRAGVVERDNQGANNFRYPDQKTKDYEASLRKKSGLDY